MNVIIGRTPNIANHVFRHLKNIYWLKFFFFIFIQLTNMSGDLQVIFLFENYFNLGNPFFVMYNVFSELECKNSKNLFRQFFWSCRLAAILNFCSISKKFLATWGCASDFLEMLQKFKMAARGQL